MSKDITKFKNVLTTGQVAQICNVAPRTVTKWFDSGQLRGYRIPGSRDRRIPASELVRFMKSHNIPTDALERNSLRILIIDDNKENAALLASELTARANYNVATANNVFEAGAAAQRFTPHAVLINLFAKGIDALQICKNIRTNMDLADTKVVAIAENISESETNMILQKGFDCVLTKNGEVAHIVKAIEDATAILY